MKIGGYYNYVQHPYPGYLTRKR